MPDLIQAVVGFRRWRIEDGLLRSTGAGQAIWDPGVTVAECETGTDKASGDMIVYGDVEPTIHPAPAPDCGCGLYAYHDPGIRERDQMGLGFARLAASLGGHELPVEIAGAVAAWGRIEIHEDGFRAERARVVALALDDRCLAEDGREDAIRAAGEQYGAAVVPSHALAREAYKHGIATPEELRPQPEPEPEPEPRRNTIPRFHSGGFVPSSVSFHFTQSFDRFLPYKRTPAEPKPDPAPEPVQKARANRGTPRDPWLARQHRRLS